MSIKDNKFGMFVGGGLKNRKMVFGNMLQFWATFERQTFCISNSDRVENLQW